MVTEVSDSSVEKTVAPIVSTSEVAVGESTQPVEIKASLAVLIEVPADGTVERSKERTEMVVAQVGGTVVDVADVTLPSSPVEDVRPEEEFKTSGEEVKTLEVTFPDFLEDSVVPLLKYLDRKREKCVVSKEQTFDKCRESPLSLHPEKCFFFMTSGILLGHPVSAERIAVDAEKVKVILALEPPTNLRELWAFLGHVGYYRRFIKMYAITATSLTKLLRKDEPYEWEEEQQKAFEELKDKLTSASVLRSPDWNKLYHVFVDTLAFAIGAVLSQRVENRRDYNHPHNLKFVQSKPARIASNPTLKNQGKYILE
ncbi:hypothetical protein AXG93_3086s1010 [Marchantia polymorpha subsp. ruderalis]|uniref:Reverse transcriptase/retrotransposon-derived protein RNase H-like domain-containing protein n=1 Tax=Marchantia polymorpha subsp. ruderalis TaxID=1480154 RepID=A0A176VVG3_MARPO|nr:hypothetical protein AXG93_3086s1010 [Marchantia polymorpha subsp. ruderalis]